MKDTMPKEDRPKPSYWELPGKKPPKEKGQSHVQFKKEVVRGFSGVQVERVLAQGGLREKVPEEILDSGFWKYYKVDEGQRVSPKYP